MTQVTFWEKPGCEGNARQQAILVAAGHRLIVKNILEERWDAATLRAFFGDLPVAHWFNRAAVEVKTGEIVPEDFDADTALALMVANPLMIRRPLMQAADGSRHVGFVLEAVESWIGLGDAWPTEVPRPEALETCARGQAAACTPTA